MNAVSGYSILIGRITEMIQRLCNLDYYRCIRKIETGESCPCALARQLMTMEIKLHAFLTSTLSLR
jgi:hypothetical protein